MKSGLTAFQALRVGLGLAGIHSVILGVVLYFFTEPLLRIMGLELSSGLFFPRQSGAFLTILGVGYGLAAVDPRRHASLVLLTIFSKAVAVVFLLAEFIRFQAPLSILLAALGDGFAGVVLLVLAVAVYHGRREKSPAVTDSHVRAAGV